MLRRSTKVQLVLFVIITLVGVSYVSAEYIGLTKGLFGDSSCTISADFVDSGGIFTNAEVTYRGYAIGQVGDIHLRKDGIRVDLNLGDCSKNRVPAAAAAVVTNRSVVGEQYINLIPKNNDGPYVKSGTVIPVSHTSIPTPTAALLKNLNDLVQSVPLDALRTTVQELGKAFNGRGDALGSLLDSTSTLLNAATQNLPDTIALINNSATVLSTQLDVQPALKVWTRSLNLIAQQLKISDPDIRRLLDHGPDDLTTVSKFIKGNSGDLAVVLANLTTVGDIVVRRLDGIEQVFQLYPALAAGGPSALVADKNNPGKNVGRLGLVANLNEPKGPNYPPDCGDPKKGGQGYNGTKRLPDKLQPIAPNVSARCTAPVSSGTNVRGSANIPGGDPISISGGGVAYPRVITDNTMAIDTSLQHVKLGDAGWIAVLTASLR